MNVDAGYQANSHKPPPEYLIPLKLTWTATGALQGGELTFPNHPLFTVGDQKLSVFTGSFDLLAKFKIAPTAPGVATGKLRHQACNDTTCFPPKTVDVTVGYPGTVAISAAPNPRGMANTVFSGFGPGASNDLPAEWPSGAPSKRLADIAHPA